MSALIQTFHECINYTTIFTFCKQMHITNLFPKITGISGLGKVIILVFLPPSSFLYIASMYICFFFLNILFRISKPKSKMENKLPLGIEYKTFNNHKVMVRQEFLYIPNLINKYFYGSWWANQTWSNYKLLAQDPELNLSH